jgi:hypothetical protein
MYFHRLLLQLKGGYFWQLTPALAERIGGISFLLIKLQGNAFSDFVHGVCMVDDTQHATDGQRSVYNPVRNAQNVGYSLGNGELP